MPYYTRTYNPQPTARVTSQELKNEFQAIDNAIDAVEVDVGKGIRAPEATTALPNAASRALKVMSFDASGNPAVPIAVVDLTAAVASAAAAAISESNAATSAANASASESSASASESSASASATSASGSASTATTQAGIATTQAGIATTQAGIATTQAGNASTSAGTATTQAGIATTKAAEAAASAASAASASGSASTATTQAGIATTKAAEAAASAATVGIPALESGKYLSNNGVDMVWQAITPPQVLRRSITGTDTLIASDLGKLINASGTFTLAVTAAATLGNGWYCWLRNTSNGDVTVDPVTTEQIDGANTFVLKPGFTVLLACDGTAFTALKVKDRTYTNIASYTASGTFVVPADTYVIRGYAWGAGAPGTSTEGGAGGGCAYGDIAVTPGETVTVTLASNIATVITASTDRLTANPAVTTTGGTASKHASVTNGGAYAGGNSAVGFYGGGSASGSPLGVGGNSFGQPGGAAWGGFSSGWGGGAGVGQSGSGTSGGSSLRTPANQFTDPLLAPLIGNGGVYMHTAAGGSGVHGGPGGGGGGTATAYTYCGNGGTGAGGGGGSGDTIGSGVGGFGGGCGRGFASESPVPPGGGGGGTGNGPTKFGAACVLIYY